MNQNRDESLNVNSEDFERKIDAALIEQEHRLPAVILNYWKTRGFEKTDPRRSAAVKAILWRIFSPGTAAAGGLTLVTIFGTLIAFQANSLLLNQNQKIDQQSFLIEAQRRAGLVTEFTSIMEQIEKEREKQTKSKSAAFPVSLILAQSTVGRIVALSRSYRPYRYLEIDGDAEGSLIPKVVNSTSIPEKEPESILSSFKNRIMRVLGIATATETETATPSLTKEALSPERGQLLITLVSSNVDLRRIVSSSADFSRSDLRNAVIIDIDLNSINLNGSNLSDSDLLGSTLKSSFLSGVKFTRSCLNNVDFDGAMLYMADLGNTSLNGSYIPDPEQLSKVILTNADLTGLIVSGDDWLERLQQQESPPIGFEASFWKLEIISEALPRFHGTNLRRVISIKDVSAANSICG